MLSGNFDPQQVERQVRRLFGDWNSKARYARPARPYRNVPPPACVYMPGRHRPATTSPACISMPATSRKSRPPCSLLNASSAATRWFSTWNNICAKGKS
ncbi:hypothetical protein [Azorhizophilus paspali]|uniref:hypothetical protein n=1 Tax=Azorhizophilus paspali TaxID=69963 RepID=UPI00362C2081